MDLLREMGYINNRIFARSPLPQGAFSAILKRVKITQIMSQELLTQGNIVEPL